MADAVTSQVNFSGSVKYEAIFTNVSDGTGEANVQKVDISGLVGAPTAVKINKVRYSIFGMSVKIAFNHTTPDTVLVLSGSGSMDFTSFGGIQDPKSTGGTGDIQFTTIGHAASDTYTIALEVGI
jgi:hypothetical protein